MIENMFGKSAFSNSSLGSTSQPTQSQISQSILPLKSTRILSASTLKQLLEIFSENRCVVVDFTNATCGPCNFMDPEFERVVEERESLVGVKVETAVAFEIASEYGVVATPTFMLFLDGVKIEEVKGASVRGLESAVDILLFTAYPPHPHTRIEMATLTALVPLTTKVWPSGLITYPVNTPVDKIFSKLFQFVSEIKEPVIALDAITSTLNEIQSMLSKLKIVQVPAMWDAVFDGLVKGLGVEKMWPLLDVLRLCLLLEPFQIHYSGDSANGLLEVIRRLAAVETKAVRLMLLRLVANLLSSKIMAETLLSMKREVMQGVTFRNVATTVIIEGLLSTDSTVRQCAASATLDVAIVDAYVRAGGELEIGCDNDLLIEWRCEVLAAVVQAFQLEVDPEIELRLLATFGKFVLLGDAEVLQVAQVLEVKEIVNGKKWDESSIAGKLKMEIIKLLDCEF
ncbi:hypothetical protein HK096_007077 [Nowakowskiella sp. JEL0078]|nr:hypothetical protein HK096_007077 [Nowakowskiella sp. JEL0078]